MDERTLIHRAQKGDTGAFEQLALPCEQMVWRVCYQLTGNQEDAEDCAQSTMIKAWKRIGQFSGSSAFSSWIYRIAVTTSTDLLRSRSREHTVSLTGLTESGFDPPSRLPGPEESILHADRDRRLREALARLSPEHRVPLILFCVEDKKYAEIASLLGIAEGTVKSRIARARHLLRREWTEDNAQEGRTSI